MNPKILKEELIKEIKVLPAQDLRIVIEFVDFIKEKEIEEEILSSKRLIGAVKRSQKAWKEKKMTEFISWDDLKKKYHL